MNLLGLHLQEPPPKRETSIARQVAVLEAEISDLRYDLERAEDELEELRKADEAWPTKDVLLAVYGAPGNWPVEAAA